MKEKDFDSQFFRQVTVALAKTMNKQIRWINRFEDKNIRVFLPFYTSLTGDQRFNLDSFVDDVIDVRVQMNTDQFQRGVITWTGYHSKSEELANPNQYLSKKMNIDNKVRKIISKVKAVPMSLSYEVEIHLATSNEIDKVSQKLLDMFFNYYFFNFDYYGLRIDAFFNLADDKTIEIPRELKMDSERKKTIKFSIEVKTYYPIFKITTDDLIVCDNDPDIDWDELDIPRPTNDFLQSIKNYNESSGTVNYVGSTGKTLADGTELSGDDKEGLTAVRKVYWSNFFHKLDQEITVNTKNTTPKNWDKENL